MATQNVTPLKTRTAASHADEGRPHGWVYGDPRETSHRVAGVLRMLAKVDETEYQDPFAEEIQLARQMVLEDCALALEWSRDCAAADRSKAVQS